MEKHKVAANDNSDQVNARPASSDPETGREKIVAVLALAMATALLPYLLI